MAIPPIQGMDLIGNIVDSNERILIGQTIAVTVLTLWVVQELLCAPYSGSKWFEIYYQRYI
jgi:hypothetical protein